MRTPELGLDWTAERQKTTTCCLPTLDTSERSCSHGWQRATTITQHGTASPLMGHSIRSEQDRYSQGVLADPGSMQILPRPGLLMRLHNKE